MAMERHSKIIFQLYLHVPYQMDDKQEHARHHKVVRAHGPAPLEHDEARHLQRERNNIQMSGN